MDKFEEAMNQSNFAFSFDGHMDDLSFEGKDKDGYYAVAQKQNMDIRMLKKSHTKNGVM